MILRRCGQCIAIAAIGKVYSMCSRMVGGVSMSMANITAMAIMPDMKTDSAR